MVVLSNCETIKFEGRCQVSSTPCDFPGWTAHFLIYASFEYDLPI